MSERGSDEGAITEATSSLRDYIEAKLEEAIRAKPGGRWFFDCPICGERYEQHDAEGRCTRTDWVEPRGIVA